MDTLNEKIEGLVKKAEKSKMPYGILKKVYDRGMAAWKTGHRPGTTPQQWAFARVNSFITKSSGTWGKADKDLAKQVRGEEVERRKTASEMLGQVKEKLPKDADAGDYIKDFKKSDAPQFKGKSDKKKEKMAVAAYLDSKEEVEEEKRQLKDPKKEVMVMKTKDTNSIQVIDKKDLNKFLSKGYIQVEDNIKEENCPDCNEDPCKCKSLQEALKINYVLIDTSRNDKVIAMSSDEQGVKDSMRTANLPPLKVKNKSSLKVVKLKRPKGDNMAGKLIGEPLKSWGEETDIQESGHTDVASMKTQVQIATDALQKMNTELGKLSDEEDLPTWWTNKVATAVSKLDGMADYIDAKSDQGETMKEENLQEGMNADTAKAILKLSLKNRFEVLRGDYVPMLYLSNADRKALKDAGHKMTRDIPKPDFGATVTGILNVANGSSRNHEDAGMYDTETDDMKGKNPAVLNMKKFVRGDFQKIGHPKTVGDLVKMTGLRLNSNDPSKNEEVIKEEYKSLNESAIGCLQAAMIDNNKSLKEEKVFVVRFEKEGMRFAVPFRDMKMAKDGEKILKKSAGVSNLSVTQDILKPGIKLSRTQEGKIVKESKMGELFLDMQMDAQEMSERDFIKTYSKQGFQAAELKRMHKEFNEEVVKESLFGVMYDKFVKAAKSMSKDKFVKTYTGKQVMPGQTKSMGKKDLEDMWVDFNEEVDNSLMAQATRVISHTSIKEKIDPADVDNIATADDRKAADKNIIIQLRRAQDMQGKADVTFKDKPNKKEKIDIKVINKALDMFDKMRPNDKAKMQTMIGKSYRDLLKTVQRGRI